MYTELFNPIYGTVRGLPVIVLGAVSDSSPTRWVVSVDDGKVMIVELSDVVVDVRYRDGKWHDTSPGGGMDDDDD